MVIFILSRSHHCPPLQPLFTGEFVRSLLTEAAKKAGIDSDWSYVCDIKVTMKGGEITTMMFFADTKCTHLDVSWIEKERSEEAAALGKVAATEGEPMEQ